MKKTVLALAVALLVLPAFGTSAKPEENRTFSGTYKWDEGQSEGPLEAVFTPIADHSWKVSFHFRFSGQPHTYTGTATGSLVEGALKGEVQTENKRGTFTFEGIMTHGHFTGTHARLSRHGVHETGTLTLE